MPDRPAATPFSAILEARARAPGVPEGRARRRRRGRLSACRLHGRAAGAPGGDRVHRHPAVPGRRAEDRARVRGDRAVPLGRPGRHPGRMPAFRLDASNSAAEQALQAGMHHDGMHFFPLPYGSGSSHARPPRDEPRVPRRRPAASRTARRRGARRRCARRSTRSACRSSRSRSQDGRWQVVRPSRYARRITAHTPCAISGPAAGTPAMRTAADPAGATVLGTYNNCAHGYTPWGTYLTCEENWQLLLREPRRRSRRTSGATASRQGPRLPLGRVRRALRRRASTRTSRTASAGWWRSIRTIPQSTPVKRTALGRIKHEGARPLGRAGRPARVLHGRRRGLRVHLQVRDRARRGIRRTARRTATCSTTARSTSRGSTPTAPATGSPLVHGQNGAHRGRTASRARPTCWSEDAPGRRPRGRDEDGPPGVDRGRTRSRARCTARSPTTARAAATAARAATRPNPRANNVFGHIIRWREDGDDPAATRFRWDIFALGGEPQNADAGEARHVQGRRLRLSRTGSGSTARRALDPDRHLADHARQGRLRAARQQPDARAPTPRPASSGASSPARAAARSPASRRRPTTARCSSTSSIPARSRASSTIRTTPTRELELAGLRPDGRPRSATVVIRRKDGGG